MDLLARLQLEISSLPGIGKRSASRLMFHLLGLSSKEFQNFVQVLTEAKEKLKPCKECFNFTEEDQCLICKNQRRNSKSLCVVERVQDLVAIEATNSYFGLYHVLGGVLSPLQGISPDQLRIKELEERLQRSGFDEMILALNSSVESDATRLYIKEIFQGKIKITELARGIPAGGELEFVDRRTIQQALNERHDLG